MSLIFLSVIKDTCGKMNGPKKQVDNNEQFVIDMFKYMDKNQDGFVSKSEVKKYTEKYGAQFLGPKGLVTFEKLDANDDEKISMEGKNIFYFFSTKY